MFNFDLRPRLGHIRGKDSRRFLLVCHFDPSGIATVYEYIALWQSASRYQIEILNMWPGGGSIPRSVELSAFDGCILHSTVSYNIDSLARLDQHLVSGFSRYDGVKVLIKQDEHRRANAVCQFLRENAFDLLITCVPPDELEKVYPRDSVGGVRFIHALTGYVSPFMREFGARPADHRNLDISYRGSIQPLSVGRLGMEKRKIGYDMAAACARSGLDLDISSRWEDRVSGTAWFDFLARSKAVLGVESGSNLFDFTGEVEAWCDEFCRNHHDKDQLSEEFYREAYAEYLKDFEENVAYAQISPRHFEAAATRSLQILYEGEYSGILTPFRHFVPLRRDLANLDDVLEIMRDERQRREITDAAFDEIVATPLYRYDRFVSRVDEAVATALIAKGRVTRARTGVRQGRPRALLLMPHEPVLDPRIEWMAEGLARDYEVCEIGTYRFNEHGAGPSFQRISDRRHRLRVERTRHDWDWLPAPRDVGNGSSPALQQLALLALYAELPDRILARAVGAFALDERVLGRFRELCRYFVNTSSALIEAARLSGSFDVIVAAGLESLPAALVLGHESDAVVVYDSHEYWPYSDIDFRHWENEFWGGLERTLASQATIRLTVSPPLAAQLREEYGCPFLSVPNCEPLAAAAGLDVEARLRRRADSPVVDFLFLGGFAPGRGIEQLIQAWPHVRAPARLLLRGPANAFRQQMERLAAGLDIKDTRVLFPEPVSEDRLVAAAYEADVGIIPYDPQSAAYRFASPNKLSQYLAAGLPIISNELDFVKATVTENRIGAAVAFHDAELLARMVERFADRELLAELSPRAQEFFKSRFNWEAVSAGFYDELRDAFAGRSPRYDEPLDFSWIESGREMRLLASATVRVGLPPAATVPSSLGAVPSPSRRLRGPRTQLFDLLVHSRSRALARQLIAALPERYARRVKSQLVLLLHRLH